MIQKAKIVASTIRLELVRERAQNHVQPVSVLFVPGLYHGAWAFRETFLPYFAHRGFTSYTMSVRGHGQSEGKESLKKARFEDYLADLKQVTQAIEGPVVLIGHSAGGMLIQKYLESESVAGAVLIASARSGDLRRAQMAALKKYPWSILKSAVTNNPDHFYHDARVCREVLFADDRSPETDRALKMISIQTESPKFVKDLLSFQAGAPLAHCPTLTIGAGNDSSVSQETYEHQKLTYGAELKLYPEKSHELIITPGWQTVADDISQWLEARVCGRAIENRLVA